jgi:hypothetical protein
VAAYEIHLQLTESLWRNRDFGQLSESGGDAVNDLAISNDAIDVIVSLHHSRPGVVREGDASFTARYGLDVGDGE